MFAQYQNLNTGTQKSVRQFIHSPVKVIATHAVVFGANGAKSRKYKERYKKTCCRPSSKKSFFYKSLMRFFFTILHSIRRRRHCFRMDKHIFCYSVGDFIFKVSFYYKFLFSQKCLYPDL